MKVQFVLFFFALVIHTHSALINAPLIVSSTRLIKGLHRKLENPKPNPFSRIRTESFIKNIFKQCRSDAYLLINQPGLTYEDFKVNDQKIFFNIQKKLSEDSTIFSFPNVEKGLSFEKISRQIQDYCEEVEIIRINIEDDHELESVDGGKTYPADVYLPRYIDIKPRIIMLNLPPLPTYGTHDYRRRMIENHDRFIRKILQRIPSPYLSFLLTSLSTTDDDELFLRNHENNKKGVPIKVFKKLSNEYNPLSWLVNDPRRLNDEPIYPEIEYDKPKHNTDDGVKRNYNHEKFLEKLKNEDREVKLFSKEFYQENKTLVILLGFVFILFVIYIAIVTVKSILFEIKSLLKRKNLEKKKLQKKKTN